MRILILLVSMLGSALSGSALAQEDSIRLRAISPRANDPAIIRYIARNATSFSVLASEEPRTPRSVILSKCGSIQLTYVEEFWKANPSRKLELDTQIAGLEEVVWPACLYVAIPPNGYAAALRDAELPVDVYMRLTGGGGSERAVQAFFAGIDPLKVARGATLRAPFVTRPVKLTLDRVTPDEFWLALQKEAKQTPGIESVIARIRIQDKGALIIATDDARGCNPQRGAPYEVKAVVTALEHAKERASQEGIQLHRSSITVVDNGFFGADSRGAEEAAFDGSPFPRSMFVREQGSIIAKRFLYNGRVIYPINYSNNIEPGPDSGHGTHVTGLVLGGPSFHDYHSVLLGPEGWAEVTILNVGAGSRDLLDGAEQLMIANLGGEGRIVNMSIAYEGTAYRNIAATFDDLFRTRRHLYIASAGNDNEEVQAKVYPAGSGGPQRDNMITVAALDNEGRFAGFSNLGAHTVDLAAPGCEISSWISNHEEPIPLSGTSQAAPLVTFAAALVRTFSSNLDVRFLKARLVSSGSLLHPTEQAWTAFRVGLNIPRALYWFDDYVRVRRAKPLAAVGAAADRVDATAATGLDWETVEYLGTVSLLTGLKCKKLASQSRPSDIWSLKRGKLVDWLYLGKANQRLEEPCETAVANSASLVFTPTYLIAADGKLVSVPPIGETIPVTAVEEVIFRSPQFRAN